jgi:hypothetical protein
MTTARNAPPSRRDLSHPRRPYLGMPNPTTGGAVRGGTK